MAGSQPVIQNIVELERTEYPTYFIIWRIEAIDISLDGIWEPFFLFAEYDHPAPRPPYGDRGG